MDLIKLQHFRNLVSLSSVDGKIDETERIALTKIAFEQGIPIDRLNIMLSRADEYVYLIPQNNKDREAQLDEMIDLALADGVMAPAELDLIKMVAQKLGFTLEELDRILEKHMVFKEY